MHYKLFYHSAVKDDILEAVRYYNEQQKNLGRRFKADIRSLIFRLKIRPHVHAVRYRDIRVAHADIFPFAVHYRMEEEKNP